MLILFNRYKVYVQNWTDKTPILLQTKLPHESIDELFKTSIQEHIYW
jgi:hypothetical protein